MSSSFVGVKYIIKKLSLNLGLSYGVQADSRRYKDNLKWLEQGHYKNIYQDCKR